jgi:hypothetical protein
MARQGIKPDTTWWERLKIFFGFANLSDYSFEGIEGALKNVPTADIRVSKVKEKALKAVTTYRGKAEEAWAQAA